MSGVWIRTGTVSISRGSHTVTGAGTAWLSGINKITTGSTFWLNNVAYEIARVNADTALELVDIYDGTDISGAAYRIQICLTDSVPELALRIAAALSYWNAESTTYLTKSDNLASLADVAMGRRNLGVSAIDSVSFRSVAVSDVSQTRANLGLDTGNDVSFKTIRVADPAVTRTNLGVGIGQDVAFQSLQLSGTLNTKGPVVFGDAVSVAKLATFSAGVNCAGDIVVSSWADKRMRINGGYGAKSILLVGPQTPNTVSGQYNESPGIMTVINGRGSGAAGGYTEWGASTFLTTVENVGAVYYSQIRLSWGTGTQIWTFNQNGDFGCPGTIYPSSDLIAGAYNSAAHNVICKSASEANGWRLAGRLQSKWSDNCFINMYWRDLVGTDSGFVVETWSYGVRKDFGMNWGSGRMFGPLGNLAQDGSDARLKKNIGDASADGLSRILQIKTRNYEWKDDTERGVCRGFIAQELQSVDPLYVYESTNQQPNQDFKILNVNRDALIADLIQAVQEQQTRIKTLESSIASLTTSNTSPDTP